jgi:hypothetical protein
MTVTVRTLAPDDADRTAMLDACHTMHANNYRPWWQCATHGGGPYPSRSEFDRMLDGDGATIFVAEEDGEPVGYYYADDVDGVILGGTLRHGPNDGYSSQMAPESLAISRVLIEAIREHTGGRCHHVGYANASVWYGFEVVLGLPQAPAPWPQAPGPTPTDWPPYDGPPKPG